jgi:hypothetical protein
VSTNGKPIENITIIEAKTNLLVEKFTPAAVVSSFASVNSVTNSWQNNSVRKSMTEEKELK